MAANGSKLHIFFFPFMASGHMIPMADMAKLFAMRGAKSTILATPANALQFSRSIQRTQELGFDIDVITIRLPLEEVGLPGDFETLTSIKSPEMLQKFFRAVRMLDAPLESLIEKHQPDCLVAGMFLPWTTEVAAKFGVPRLVFHGTSYFSLGATESVRLYRPHENVSSDSEPFEIPNFPGAISMTRSELQDFMLVETEFTKFYNEVKKSELTSYGVLVNSFYELEAAFADHYSKVLGRKSWGIGPVSMCNQGIEEKLTRGKGSKAAAAVNGSDCLKWLDKKEPDSVIYVCFGSFASFSAHQLHEIAVGLEASGQQFVWVVKKDENVEEGAEEWLPQGYEERMRDKGLIIRGWAPQVPILEHRAVGSFVTHCGWNSTLEGISAGVGMVTWPVTAEQFYNEKLVIKVLGIGTPVGVKRWTRAGGDNVGNEMVEAAVKRVMVGEKAEEMRRKARELSEMAKKAVGEGGSSYSNVNSVLDELRRVKISQNLKVRLAKILLHHRE